MTTAKETVDGKPVDPATAYEIETFLKREARLLDSER